MRNRRSALFRNDTYVAGNAWFICDRCGGRYRRSAMITEWDGLKVDARCLDPRPPQMIPPVIYPEGLPFYDARSPQDNPDRMQDDTYLQPTVGGINITIGQYNNLGPGALSPQDILETVQANLGTETGFILATDDGDLFLSGEATVPQGPNVLQDDITIITGTTGAFDLPSLSQELITNNGALIITDDGNFLST